MNAIFVAILSTVVSTLTTWVLAHLPHSLRRRIEQETREIRRLREHLEMSNRKLDLNAWLLLRDERRVDDIEKLLDRKDQ